MAKELRLLMSLANILEYGEYGKYEFTFQGHNLNKEEVILYMKKELEDYDNELVFDKIIEIYEGSYYTTRFFEGSDAKDEGYNCWIEFCSKESYKKGYGKCTTFTIILKNKPSEARKE